ncbi:MAG: hypothetical protein HKN26_11705 [Acidimicrobiales bacterium]|nr:hypothetical protein [Acidimicrobiales bacterium]
MKPAEPRTVDLLVASGVHLDTWTLPQELHERPLTGSPINHDDILDFHAALHDNDSLMDALESIQ